MSEIDERRLWQRVNLSVETLTAAKIPTYVKNTMIELRDLVKKLETENFLYQKEIERLTKTNEAYEKMRQDINNQIKEGFLKH